jgi:threonine/homoserine/homoserine lactone efflux protein
MLTFLPDLPVILAFTLAAWLLAATPGPDMTLFLARTLSSGRAAGLMSLAGASTGTMVHTALAVLGVSAIIAASATAFTVLKLAGAAYLLWLAVEALWKGSSFTPPDQAKKGRRVVSLKRAFMAGIGINLLNPKIVLFFMTFLPQFVSVDDPQAAQKMAFLGLYFVVVCAPPLVVLIFAAEKFSAALSRNPRIGRIIDYLFASVFAVFAVRILFEEGR